MCVFSFTFDDKFSWTLHSAQIVLCDDGVIPAVLGPDFEYHHGADPTCVGDVVVSVGVEADIVSVPGNMGFGVSCHRAAHVALIALWTVVRLQWHREWRRLLEAAVLGGRKVQRKWLWKEVSEKERKVTRVRYIMINIFLISPPFSHLAIDSFILLCCQNSRILRNIKCSSFHVAFPLHRANKTFFSNNIWPCSMPICTCLQMFHEIVFPITLTHLFTFYF